MQHHHEKDDALNPDGGLGDFGPSEVHARGSSSPPAVDDEIRVPCAAALWQLYGMQDPDQHVGPEPKTPVATSSGWHRILDFCRRKACPPTKTTIYSFGLGVFWGILCSSMWGPAMCERRWWQDYTDLAWAWKVSRWDSRWAFAWCDTFSFSVLQTGALWMAGWVTGPRGAAVAASVGTTFLQANGVFPSAMSGAQTYQQWPNMMQQQQLQCLQAYMAQGRQFAGHDRQQTAWDPRPRPRKPKALPGPRMDNTAAVRQNYRAQGRALTEEQITALRQMLLGGAKTAKRQRQRWRRGQSVDPQS